MDPADTGPERFETRRLVPRPTPLFWCAPGHLHKKAANLGREFGVALRGEDISGGTPTALDSLDDQPFRASAETLCQHSRSRSVRRSLSNSRRTEALDELPREPLPLSHRAWHLVSKSPDLRRKIKLPIPDQNLANRPPSAPNLVVRLD